MITLFGMSNANTAAADCPFAEFARFEALTESEKAAEREAILIDAKSRGIAPTFEGWDKSLACWVTR